MEDQRCANHSVFCTALSLSHKYIGGKKDVPYVSESVWKSCVYRARFRTRKYATFPCPRCLLRNLNDVNNILYMLCRINSHLFTLPLSVRHYVKRVSESQHKRIAGFKSKFVNKVLVSFLAIQKFSEYLSRACL